MAIAKIQEFQTQYAQSFSLGTSSQRIAKLVFSIFLGIANLTGSMAAESVETMRLQESDRGQLELSLVNNNPDGLPEFGRFEYRHLNCGGKFTTEGYSDDGLSVILNLEWQHGRCSFDCKLLLDKEMRSYKEICDGRILGEGNFEQTSSTSKLKALASAGAASLQARLKRLEQEKAENISSVEKLAKLGKCDEAKKFVESLDKRSRPSYSHTTCLSDARVLQIQSINDPQLIYVRAARLESEGDRSTAERLYSYILDTFPSSQIAIKAADRITAIADVRAMLRSNQGREEALRESNREAEKRSAEMRDSIDRTNRDAGDRAYNQCKIEVDACYDRGGKSCYRNCDSLR